MPLKNKDIVPIIAVDFDGTLVSNAYPKIGDPNEKLIAILQRMYARGDRLVLWTCRTGKNQDEARRFCERIGLPLWGVNVTPPCAFQDHISYHSKMYANVYVDDAAVSAEELLLMEKAGLLR